MNENTLSRLILKLDAEGLNYKKASDFHGVLFSLIDHEYAEFLHRQQLHPYSQYIYFKNGGCYWYIHALNSEAYIHIIEPLLKDEFNQFQIHNGNIGVSVTDKTLTVKKYSNLMEEFYDKPVNRDYEVEVRTYTSFKQRGRYNITPDLRLFFQSLMMKYSAVSGNEIMADEETLEQLTLDSVISRYRLKTGVFPVEGRTIPGFMGTMGIKVFGSDTMMRYVRLLLQFGEYSGIGIKTAIGMGAIKIIGED
ncbi:CRISPR-associated endoribonuclease Cas6 [[Clostridium] aminophilum]|uniref:CRISPR-associated endoribonuclease Cas6 n=1 Tax=[Clostridium] aminophilum TaxID=1526 RepID=A0A1I0B4F3_9FIRM|nr:CRISPR-associated endoribonuclease Cas6 [[Clostridium] aminophilum]SET01630.1 CRISPR-associated endoribonuclease Cas6 [[Clostridium] aminophilum]